MREYMKKGKKGEKTWNQEEGGRLIVTGGGEENFEGGDNRDSVQ